MPRKKVILVGRGEPTPRQLQLLKKALKANEIEIATQIEQLTSPKQVTETIEKTGAVAVLSFIMHPTVIGTLQITRGFVINFDYFVVKTETVKTATVASKEAEKLCREVGADIVSTKVLPNGEISVRCTRTVSLLKNPVLCIEAEEEIQ